MKIAAIALASAFAASLGLAQPASAQQNYGESGYGSQQDFNSNNDNTQSNHGPMMGNPSGGPMTNNGNPQWMGNGRPGQQAQNQNWRHGQNQNSSPGQNQNWGSMHRSGMMHGHMGPMGHRRAMMSEGTSFAFGNGKARIFVHCRSESLQDCKKAANDLLDQIASSRNSAASNSSTNGSGSSSTGAEGSSGSTQSGNGYGKTTGSGSIVTPGHGMQDNGQSGDQNPASDQPDSGE
jgi:hypothetical protein